MKSSQGETNGDLAAARVAVQLDCAVFKAFANANISYIIYGTL